jgi:hypothetical protein
MKQHNILSRALQIVFLCTALSFMSPRASAGEAANVRITSMAMAVNNGNHVYIQVSASPAGRPTCASHNFFHYTLALDTAAGRSLYAILLSAEAQGTLLHLSGYNLCTQDSTVESLRSATTYK